MRLTQDRVAVVYSNIAAEVFGCYRPSGRLTDLGGGDGFAGVTVAGAYVAYEMSVLLPPTQPPSPLPDYTPELFVRNLQTGRLKQKIMASGRLFVSSHGVLAWIAGDRQFRQRLFVLDATGEQELDRIQTRFADIHFRGNELSWRAGTMQKGYHSVP
jgi:hypothetical protein